MRIVIRGAIFRAGVRFSNNDSASSAVEIQTPGILSRSSRKYQSSINCDRIPRANKWVQPQYRRRDGASGSTIMIDCLLACCLFVPWRKYVVIIAALPGFCTMVVNSCAASPSMSKKNRSPRSVFSGSEHTASRYLTTQKRWYYSDTFFIIALLYGIIVTQVKTCFAREIGSSVR